jgi:hypothetical protein
MTRIRNKRGDDVLGLQEHRGSETHVRAKVAAEAPSLFSPSLRSGACAPAVQDEAFAPVGPAAREAEPVAKSDPPGPEARDSARKEALSLLYRAPARQPGTWLFGLLVAAALYAGWASRGERYLTAESGLGYALGIAGAATMLLLLLYPLRKKLRGLRWLGATKHWFRAHMAFGVLGPAMILFHANFALGSTNSNVALFSMLLVVLSGFVGRYFYSRIHYGLYGRRMSLAELRELAQDTRSSLGQVLSFAPHIQARLDAAAAAVLEAAPGVAHSAGRLLALGIATRRAHSATLGELKRALREEAGRHDWTLRKRWRRNREAQRCLSVYFSAVRRVAEFSFFERLFSLWHTLHLPLFAILFIASVVHIVAVHLY